MSEAIQSRNEVQSVPQIPAPEWRTHVGVTAEQLEAAKRASDYWVSMGRVATAPVQPTDMN